MKAISFTCFVVPFLSTHFFVAVAMPGQIGMGAFTPAATIQTFESLGVGTTNYTSPLVIASDSYDADDHRMASGDKLGFAIGRTGVALGNNAEQSTAPSGFMQIDLGTPVLRAGMFIGFEFSWAADAKFYNTSNEFLGTISLSGVGRDNHFAGWQADAGMIGRIRVENVLGNNYRLIIDDVIQEVPEPHNIQMILLGILVAMSFNLRTASRCVHRLF